MLACESQIIKYTILVVQLYYASLLHFDRSLVEGSEDLRFNPFPLEISRMLITSAF